MSGAEKDEISIRNIKTYCRLTLQCRFCPNTNEVIVSRVRSLPMFALERLIRRLDWD